MKSMGTDSIETTIPNKSMGQSSWFWFNQKAGSNSNTTKSLTLR